MGKQPSRAYGECCHAGRAAALCRCPSATMHCAGKSASEMHERLDHYARLPRSELLSLSAPVFSLLTDSYYVCLPTPFRLKDVRVDAPLHHCHP